ncbi:hypothetical protein ABWH92_06330 [Ahrensia marina]|uniref:hypothetical protein n=1 Tax=Ahrensia marina TaxID=1514904 RepID=UPI0035CF4460
MTASTLRRTLRWVHIATSLVIGTYLYSPWSSDPTFTAIALYGVFPLMGLSGLAMWQQGRLARLLK